MDGPSHKRSTAMKVLLFVLVGLYAAMVPAFGQNSDCDTLEKCQAAIQLNPKNSLAHYRLGEIFFAGEHWQLAADELRNALHGDRDPKWTQVWSHITLGKIFDITGQRDRALGEYGSAQRLNDNTRGAQEEATKYLKSPFRH
jgi:tetratricopeptide (TPR) repeat protein